MRCVCSSALLKRSEVVIFNGVKATQEATGQPSNLTRKFAADAAAAFAESRRLPAFGKYPASS
jgi:hypothetical protein